PAQPPDVGNLPRGALVPGRAPDLRESFNPPAHGRGDDGTARHERARRPACTSAPACPLSGPPMTTAPASVPPAPGHSSPIAVTAPVPAASPLRAAITAAWLGDETANVRALLAQARLDPEAQVRADALATALVQRVRARAGDQGAIEAFMGEYDLGSEEGVLLMCVAEALLRIPDQDTADRLIRDKLGDADWERHLGQSGSVLVNASTWGLMLTGRLVQLNDLARGDLRHALRRMVGRLGEPVVRLAVRQAMRIMGHQFVMGRTIDEALARANKGASAGSRQSFDMLGE